MRFTESPRLLTATTGVLSAAFFATIPYDSCSPPPRVSGACFKTRPRNASVRLAIEDGTTRCSIEYVTDPERFFDEADYMMKVAIEGTDRYGEDRDRWRLLVLEDTGELLSADAKSREGQRLSRLLNVVDGLIGQGLKLMLLITTNEELRSLHPAVSRPGRCAAVLEFPLFTAEEAADWLVAHASDAEPPVRAALADLYALHACAPARARPASVGFATA